MKKRILIVIFILSVMSGIWFIIYFSRTNVVMRTEKQMDVFVEKIHDWSNINGYFYFTIGDLNQDGKLELVTSTIQGSGSFSSTRYYIVNDKDLIVLQEEQTDQCSSALINDLLQEGQRGEGGILYVPVYYDKQKNMYYYIHHDYSGHTPYESIDRIISLSMKDNIIREEVLAYKKITKGNGINSIIFYEENSQNEISEVEYEKIIDLKYNNCEKMQMRWKWKRVEAAEEITDTSKEEIKKILMEMYGEFEIRNIID